MACCFQKVAVPPCGLRHCAERRKGLSPVATVVASDLTLRPHLHDAGEGARQVGVARDTHPWRAIPAGCAQAPQVPQRRWPAPHGSPATALDLVVRGWFAQPLEHTCKDTRWKGDRIHRSWTRVQPLECTVRCTDTGTLGSGECTAIQTQ